MQLLQHFKELTIHPKNAEELKGLILQLAIQGKLTAKWRVKNTDIEHSSELLRRIHQEKERLIRDKIIRREKKVPSINNDEIPYDLPETWSWERLGNYVHNFGQKKPDKNFEYIDVASIDNKLGLIKTELKNLKASEAPSRARKLVKKGCVIYSTVRPYLLNIAIVNREFKNEAIASTAFAILNPMLGTSEMYLYHLLRSYLFTNYVQSCMKGVAYPAINDNNLMRGLIPVPPLKEQKEIVKVVETLFKEVEQLEQLTIKRVSLKEDFVTSALHNLTTKDTHKEWKYLQRHFKSFFNETSNIKRLRETILQLAIQGKLTADWRVNNPNLEDASLLLKRIQEEKGQLIKDKKIKREKALPLIAKEDIPYELPKGWVWCRMGEISEKLGAGSTPSGGKTAYVDEGIKFFRSQNIYNTYLKLDQVAYITDVIHEKMKGTKVKPKDILLNITGGSIGRCSLISDDFDTANVSQHVAIVRMIELDTRKFIHQFIISKSFQDRIMDVQVGVSREGLSMTKLKMFPIPLPPLEEQKVIVEKVNALMNLCDALEHQVQKSKEQSELLMQSVLKEVFEPKEDVLKDLLPDIDKYAQVAMVTLKMENTFGFRHGKVEKQKTGFLLQAIKKQPIPYTFEKQHFGTFSWELSEDLDKNPYLRKVKAGQGQVYEVKSTKQNEVLSLLNAPENASYVQAIDELIQVYQMPQIKGQTEEIELLNTVCKSILDTKSTNLDTICADMEFWTIKQDGFNSKAEKFSRKRTEKMLELVLQLGWDKKLIN